MSIAQNLTAIRADLPKEVSLVAVSKTKPVGDLMEAYDAGQRIFGENKIQEMVDKHNQMPKDIQWHMIGHVQRNKVKYMAGFVDLIHAVDSLRLLIEINKQAQKHERKIQCLLQIKIAEEDSKFGLDFESARKLLDSEDYKNMEHVEVIGLMGMATFTEDMTVVEKEFKYLKQCYDHIKSDGNNLDALSMGMSGDYKLAIKNGSNMVRIGSHIFGARNY
ncbi:YggS family pyridoxal phosphate-dependent enzyme [Winogradskyella aurantiaca]|uniref:YggS family pyridoxal phosphate-dependent enzyme n=1 Tax=Winogradskyella aurantiaca TaxID=2219558 RepID=UPI000E1D2E10|nr:YggS family pyridoxal phosphate-dependent enzyme [Winogradskyella aurantiaca]